MTPMTNADISRYSKRIVQLFWDPEPKNNDYPESPVWCLGRRYQVRTLPISSDSESPTCPSASASASKLSHSNDSAEQSETESSLEEVTSKEAQSNPQPETEQWPSAFLDDFESRIWLTYRFNFPPIPRSTDHKTQTTLSLSTRLKNQLVGQGGFTSDTGWGCMIRSGQSLLANALILATLGRDWTRADSNPTERRILSLFADDPRAPLSIHKFVEHGAKACGTFPGQWFGPSATARCIQALSNDCEHDGIRVYITGDGPDVYEDQLFKIAKGDGSVFQPTLLLVGTRLGIDRVTPVYWEALKASLQMEQSAGIAGGRPSSSHYFVGVQESNFFYLDPHQTRTALPFHENLEDYTAEEINSCHTRRLRRLPIEEMDPSMLIAFLFRDESEWMSWRRTVSGAPGKAIFHIADTQPTTYGSGLERADALDEVETFDDEESEVRE